MVFLNAITAPGAAPPGRNGLDLPMARSLSGMQRRCALLGWALAAKRDRPDGIMSRPCPSADHIVFHTCLTPCWIFTRV